jgi:hypothetical protein
MEEFISRFKKAADRPTLYIGVPEENPPSSNQVYVLVAGSF